MIDTSPQYGKYLVTFLDILGLSAAIKITASRKGIEPIAEMLEKVRSIADTINGTAYEKYQVRDFAAFVFSDTIVISCPNVSTKSFKMMAQIVSAIQFEICRHSFFLRGAMTVGYHFEKEGVVFGPAFIRAYEMERYAIWPRVLIDPVLLRRIRLKASEIYSSDVVIDQTGWGYLNYLKFVFTRDCWGQLQSYRRGEVKDIDYSRITRLHKHAIIDTVNKLKPSTQLDVVTKYYALADYHNHFIYSLRGLSSFLEVEGKTIDPEVTVRILLANSRDLVDRQKKKPALDQSLRINEWVKQVPLAASSFQECEIDLIANFKQIYI